MVRITLLLLFLINNAFATIQVRVNKTQISSVDNLTVLIDVDNVSGNQTLDISALTQDFNIVNRAQSSSRQSINGKVSSAINLRLTLQPKRIGELIIPTFEVGGQTSKPIKIKVDAVDEASFEKNIIFIKTSLSNLNPMVQEQVIYTVSLYSHSKIQHTQLDFTPQIANVKVKKIAQANTQVNFKNQPLWKKDFNFAIYPQKIGKFSIPGIRQTVSVGSSNQVLLFAESSNLTVLAADENYPLGEYWLPAMQVELSEKPLDKSQKIIAGEPFVRQIMIKVSAQSAIQVPPLKFSNNSLFEQYADSNSSTERLKTNNIISMVAQDILIIPNRFGEQILPEIKLTWFDTNENKTKIARLAEVKIQVEPPSDKPKTLVLPKLEDRDISVNTTKIKPILSKPTYWKSIALFSIALWLLTLMLCWFYRPSKPKKVEKIQKMTDIDQLKMIKKYAKKNDARATKRALDAWVFECYGLLNTNIFAKQLGADFADEMLILQQNLYQSNQPWDGAKFYQVLASTIKSTRLKKTKDLLPELYPSSF